ncbi:MAG TPA: ATP-binding protein [Gemmatimonadales bacterium]|nr:ATP-binding protein [Gemmatimonadales bacterium]
MPEPWSGEVPRAERTRAAFFEVSRRLSAAGTAEEAARIIAGVAQELLGWDACTLDLYFPETNRVQDVLTMDSFDGPPVDVPATNTANVITPMFARVLREGALLILRPDPEHDPAIMLPFGNTSRRSRSLMFVPLHHGDRITGILSIQSYTPDAYDQTDLIMLQELADHCGGAIERLRIENELRESRAQLARTEEFALVMTAHLGLDGRWLKVPPTLCRLLGLAESELVGTPIELLLHPDDLPIERAERDRLLRGETRTLDLEMRWRPPGGRALWMYVNASVVQDAKARPQYLLVYLRDITERKSLEDQLRVAQKMEAVGQLAGGIAHDFNNLLTAILGSTELLLANTVPDDPRREDVQEIGRAAHRASALVRQLLAFSRKQVMQPRQVNLNSIVREMGGMLRRLVGERIALRLDLDPALGDITADPGQVEQVIANLGVNARDAMPDGGMLTIATANVSRAGVTAAGEEGIPADSALVALTVRDTGTGMDEHVLAHLFEPFFTTKELGRGTGLGLATVYGIVRQSGGQIQVASRPGEGSRFTVYFPRLESAPRSGAVASEPPLPVPGGHETVLVAEDEEAVRHLVCRVLRAKGYRVLDAANAEAALALAATTADPIDLLVTDMVMPGLGGTELAAQLLTRRPGLRVLFMTGYAPEAIESGGQLADAGGLLEKPFSAEDLARKVREVLAAPA